MGFPIPGCQHAYSQKGVFTVPLVKDLPYIPFMKSIEALPSEKLLAEIEKIKAETRQLRLANPNSTSEETRLQLKKLKLEIEKLQSDIEQSSIQTRNIEHLWRSDAWKFWVGIIGPTISALALIGTLFFQLYSSSEDRKSKIQADEDTQ